MKQDLCSRDIEHGRGSAPAEALAESRTSLSEWQTDPELKFYGRAMSSVTSKRLAGQRLALEIYALVVVVLAAAIVVATYAYSLNRWHDGNGSPLKDEPSVNLGSKLSATDHFGYLAFRRYVAFVIAATCIITGLGAEIVIGKALVSALSTKTGTTLWHFTQLLFSLFLMIAILAAPEQVGEGPGVADVAAVAQNYPPRCYAVVAHLSPSSSETLINKMYPLVIKGESPILAEAWWPISAGY